MVKYHKGSYKKALLDLYPSIGLHAEFFSVIPSMFTSVLPVLCCLFCFVLFCFVLFCFVLFCFVLFCFVLFCFVLFCFVLFCFVLFCFFLV